jgi:choline dehydrogenase
VRRGAEQNFVLSDLIDLASSSFGHPVGTCRIGTDAMAVVDPKLRVHGQNLRVADSSVMPSVPTAATNAASIMLGGKVALLQP